MVIDPSLLGMAGNLRSSTLGRLEPSQNTGVPSVILLKKENPVRVLLQVYAVFSRKAAPSLQTRVPPQHVARLSRNRDDCFVQGHIQTDLPHGESWNRLLLELKRVLLPRCLCHLRYPFAINS